MQASIAHTNTMTLLKSKNLFLRFYKMYYMLLNQILFIADIEPPFFIF